MPRCGTWLRQYAKDHPRRGFRPAYHDARGEGWNVNHKKVQRLWREEACACPNVADANAWAPPPRLPAHG